MYHIKQSLKFFSVILLILTVKINANAQQCPSIFINDMNNVPGYPRIDDVSVCGVPDTITFYILNTSGQQLNSSEFTLDIPPGFQYAGFFEAVDPNYPVSQGSTANPNQPSFVFENLGASAVQIISIGVIANCEIYRLPPNAEFKFDVMFDFLFKPQNGGIQPCTTNVLGAIDYSPFIKRPTINILSQSQQNMKITGDSRCNNIVVSQNGINATLAEFTLQIYNYTAAMAANIGIQRIRVSGVDLPYTYDPITSIISVDIDSSVIPNGALGEDESMTVQVCYEQLLDCETSAELFSLSYAASFGCSADGRPCIDPSVVDGTVQFTPTYNPTISAGSQTLQLPAICGDNAIFAVQIDNNGNTDPVRGLWQEVKLGFQICEADAFDAVDVRINGASLPPGTFYYNNFDFVVDATQFPLGFDPDPGTGFEDLDGDGFFDDLPGGATVNLEIEAAIKCQDPQQIAGCAAIDCEFRQVFMVGEVPIDVNQTGSIIGYQFPNGTDIGGGVGSTDQINMEFCYEFGSEGVEGCTNTNSFYEIEFGGFYGFTQDIEIVASSVTYDGAPVPAANVTKFFPYAPADSGIVVFRIDAGSNGLDRPLCYQATFELDSCICYPRNYFGSNHRVVEECLDCAPETCTIVRACEETLVRSQRSCQCVCPMSSDIVELRRTEFGFTDNTMTTQLDETTVDPVDLARFLPCDSMYVHVEYDVLDANFFNLDMNEIVFRLWTRSTLSWSFIPAMEVFPDMTHAALQEFGFEKLSAPGSITPIDFAGTTCFGNNSLKYRNINDGFLDGRGFSPYAITPQAGGASTYNSGRDVFDNREFHFWIQDGQEMFEGIGGNITGNTDIDNTSANCWSEIIDNQMGGLETGDKFHMIVKIPMQLNPYRCLNDDIAAEAPVDGIMRGDAYWYRTANGSRTYVGGTCGSNFPYQLEAPKTLSTVANIETSDCSATVEHIIYAPRIDSDWYQNEYRPIIQLNGIQVPLVNPLIYAGNAQIVQPDGTTLPLSDPAFDSNVFCTFYNGQDYCTSSGGTGYGTFTGTQLPMLGVGLPDQPVDSIVITYDYF